MALWMPVRCEVTAWENKAMEREGTMSACVLSWWLKANEITREPRDAEVLRAGSANRKKEQNRLRLTRLVRAEDFATGARARCLEVLLAPAACALATWSTAMRSASSVCGGCRTA